MNQTKKMGVWAILLLLGTIGAQAQTILTADFSAAQGYVNGPVAGQPAGGGAVWTNPNSAVSIDSFKVENEALSIIGDGVGGKWVVINIPTQKDIFAAEFEGTYVGDGTMSNIGVSFSDTENFKIDGNTTPTYNEQGAMVRFAGNGILDVRNGDGAGGGSFTKLVDFAYNDGVKFYIRAVIDAFANLVTVYVHKEGETEEILIAEDYGFRRATSTVTNGLNCMTIFDNNSDSSKAGVGIIFDNFKVYGPDGLTPVSEWSIY